MAIAQNFPIIAPSLSLDFANVQALDPRITYARASTATYYGTRTALAEQNLFLQSAVPYPSPWAWTNGYIGSLGSELVTNGNFSSATGWVGNTGIITGGVAAFVAVAGSIYQNILTVGKRYKLELVVSRFVAAGTFRVRLGGGGSGDLFLNITGTGTYTITGIASANTTFEMISYTTACDFDIDSVSVKESVQNFVAAPDGTSTASTLVADAANATFTQSATVAAGQVTFSVYLRRVSGTGDVQIQTGNGTFVTQTITSTWTRYTDTQTVSAGLRTWGIRLVTSGDQVEVWGAQLEQRSTVTAYTPTTTQPITNYIPVLETAASGVARFDHNPTTFESLGLLIEQQSTNLVLQSENFSLSWSLLRTTNSITNISPAGTQTANQLVETTATGTHVAIQTISKAASAITYTASVYLKAAGRNNAELRMSDQSGNGVRVVIDLSAGTTGTPSIFGTGISAGAATISTVGNGWYRITLSGTSNSATTWSHEVYILDAILAVSYAGNGYSGLFVWGAQLEALAFPTSYIPTVASQVTRAADSAEMTGTNFSSWFNNAEFSLYQDIQFQTGSPVTLGNSFSNYINTVINNTFSAQIGGTLGGTAFTTQSYNIIGSPSYPVSTFVANQRQVAAFAMSLNSFASGYSGAGATTTPTLNPASATFGGLFFGGTNFASQNFSGRIRKIAFYPKALTATNLQALTS